MIVEILSLLVAFVVVSSFLGALVAAKYGWRKLPVWKRMLGLALLIPHACLILSLTPFLSCGIRAGWNGPLAHVTFMGEACPDALMGAAVLAVFVLPLPAIAGTGIAFGLFLSKSRR